MAKYESINHNSLYHIQKYLPYIVYIGVCLPQENPDKHAHHGVGDYYVIYDHCLLLYKAIYRVLFTNNNLRFLCMACLAVASVMVSSIWSSEWSMSRKLPMPYIHWEHKLYRSRGKWIRSSWLNYPTVFLV